jgi:hypothetical protein
LQIDFADDQGAIAKDITIPDPLDNLTAKDIIAAIVDGAGGTNIYFGISKIECDISTYGYIRHYAANRDEGERLLLALAQLSNGTIVPKSMRHSDRERDIKTGFYTAARAYLFQFKQDGSEPKCTRFDLR